MPDGKSNHEVHQDASNVSASRSENSSFTNKFCPGPEAAEGWVFAFCDFSRSNVAFVNSSPPVSIHDTLQAAKQHCFGELLQSSTLKGRLVLLFSKFTLGTAIVNDIMIVPNITTGTGPYYLEVDLIDMQTSLPLTRAWHGTLNPTSRLVVTRDLFSLEQVGVPAEVGRRLVGRKVLVVKMMLDQAKIIFPLIMTTVVLGVSIGLASSSAEVGVAVSAFGLASISALHGLSALTDRNYLPVFQRDLARF